MRTDVFIDIKLSGYAAFDLLTILQNYIEFKNEEIKQAEEDKKAGRKTAFFDDYTDYLLALEAHKDKAKELLKSLQKQTGMKVLHEPVIDEM